MGSLLQKNQTASQAFLVDLSKYYEAPLYVYKTGWQKLPSGGLSMNWERAMVKYHHSILDLVDTKACMLGCTKPASWDLVTSGKVRKLYAGRLGRHLPQFKTHLGLTPYEPSWRNIAHDVRFPMPVASGSVDAYQAEDVFEHIPYGDLTSVINEVFRVLKPGGLFRLSVPNYQCDVTRDRTLQDQAGNLLFDPGGGGEYVDGKVIGGGHVWFPEYASVKALLNGTCFESQGTINFLHYTLENGQYVLHDIDYSKGHIQRTPDHDSRAMNPRRALSVIVDAIKH